MTLGGFKASHGHCLVLLGRLGEAETVLLDAERILVSAANSGVSSAQGPLAQARRDLMGVYERLRMPERAAYYRARIAPE